MVMDATIVVTSYDKETPERSLKEVFYPFRHNCLTLPLNGINNFFQTCDVSFNHHTHLNSDRYEVTLPLFLFLTPPPPV